MKVTRENRLRRCYFNPYAGVARGPRYELVIYDTGRMTFMKPTLGYWLKQDGMILFTGEDFVPSCMHAIDSDQTVKSLMGFLTVRPGDTDAEYFDNYTDEQREFCKQHAESLAIAVIDRFGE